MADSAAGAGLTSRGFTRLLGSLAEDPAGAFADLRELLTDATTALLASRSSGEAYRAMARLDRHRMAPLLPRYELANWVLHARAYGAGGAWTAARPPSTARSRRHPVPLEWLTTHWVATALGRGG